MRKLQWFFAFFILLSSIISSASVQAASQIDWRPWSRGIFETAKKEHKLILIYGKVNWCHWCQKMDASTFPNPSVVQLINRRFVPVKVNVEEDRAISQRYRINEFPSLIVLNDHNEELMRSYGYASANTVVRKLSRFAS